MIKKLLFTLLMVSSLVVSGQQIMITTTSSSNAWSPFEVLKSGGNLTWSVADNGFVGASSQNVNDPTFDFSSNNGTPIVITVTSADGFGGLTRLDFWNDNGVGSEITDLDVSAATSLDRLNTRINNLSALDVSQNTVLRRLYVRSNSLLTSLDISNNTLLNRLQINNTGINSIDLSNNPLLINLRLDRAELTDAVMDQAVIDLDNHGLSNGVLRIENNPGNLTNASLSAYNNLIAKGWTIDVSPPPAPSVETIVLTTTSTSNAWSPFEVLNTGTTLKWAVSGGVVIGETEIDDPTFDLSGNTGVATITITSDFGFAGLERLDFWNDNGVGSEITTINVDNADDLDRLNLRINNLTSVDVSQNVNLTRLWVRSNPALSALDVSANTQLNRLHLNGTAIASISLANNPLLNNVRLDAAQLDDAQLDQAVIDLDNHGLSNGTLRLENNPGQLTTASLTAYNNLIAKGWTIDVGPPPAPSVETIVMTTTSTSNAWSPFEVLNSGATLKWAVTGGVTIGETEIDDPTFDLSGNTGVATITITSDFGFAGLTRLDLWNDNGVGSELTTLDVTNAGELDRLGARFNELTTLDVSQNTVLDRLVIRGNPNLAGTLDISANTLLTRLQADGTAITGISLLNNTLLTDVRLYGAQLTSAVLDQVVIDLDAHGLSNGNLEIRNNAEELTSASATAYNNLIAKGWTIDVGAPPTPSVETIVMTTTSTSNAWSPFEVLNSGATLKWEVTGGVTIGETEIDDPTFDLSGNTGIATITITSDFGFAGLTRLDLWNDNGVGSELTTLDVTNAGDLDRLGARFNELTTLDVSQNTLLDRLIIRGNPNLAGTLDISANTLLTRLQADGTAITGISLLNNTLLTDVRLYGAQLTSAVLDQIVIDLDAHGLSNGNLEIRNNPESLTSASSTAYQNLITRGWTIDVNAPPTPSVETIVLTTTSTSSAWSPFDVQNSGATLKWEVTGGVVIPEVEIDDPTFDLSGNTGVATITITSDFGFSGLERLDFWNDNGVGSEITNLDVSNAHELERLNTRFNELTTLDVSQNTLLDRLIVRGNDNLAGTLDISTNVNLDRIQADATMISSIDVSNNPLLNDVRIYDAQLTSAVMDQLVIDLDNHGLSNGNLQLLNNAEELTTASLTAYNNLIAKGWTIDVAAPPVPGAHIRVLGNGLEIPSSASAILENGTDFDETTIGNPITNQFTIENYGDEDLVISLFLPTNPADFSATPPASLTIPAGGTETFEVSFNPSTIGAKAGSVIIQSNDPDTNVYVLNVIGDAVEVLSNQIMITQYYSGFSGDDNWIEVKNISNNTIPANTYYVVLFNEAKARFGVIESATPDASYLIENDMAPGDVWLFQNAAATLPSNANIGTGATRRTSSICDLSGIGDDLLLISTSNGNDSYNFRADIIGNIGPNSTTGPTPWGRDVSLIKGGCASETPNLDFDINDWISISPLTDVDDANPTTNIALGTQLVGSTEYDGSSWSNGLPDRSRNVILTTSFTGGAQTIEACNLTINPGVNVVFDSNGATKNSIEVFGDMVISGSLTIGDTESLVTWDSNASLGEITKIERSNDLSDINESTYWSSPVVGAQLSAVFAGVDASRIFDYRPGAVNPDYAGTSYEHWFVATGTMATGYGYAAAGASTGVQTITYTGIPNNGSISLNLYYKGSPDTGTDNDNFNLIGNPYPTAINIDDFLVFNSAVQDIALWTQGSYDQNGEFNPADYVYYNQGGSSTPPGSVSNNIGSGQGFMARTWSNAAVVFENGFKLVDQNDQFFKSTNDKGVSVVAANDNNNKIWLELRDQNNVKSNIMIGFVEGATDGEDRFYDSYGLSSGKNINLYSIIPNVDSKYVIQSLSEFDGNRSIQIGFDSESASQLRLGLAAIQGNTIEESEIYLVDTYTGIRHDLRQGDYRFNSESNGEYADRFKLEFKYDTGDLPIDQIIDGNEFSVTNRFDNMSVRSGKPVEVMNIYDMLGRLIIQKRPGLKAFDVNTSEVKIGTIMIIEARLNDGTMVNKKSIKQ